MSRLPNILPEDLTESQQKVFDCITGGKRGTESDIGTFVNEAGGLRGPFNALLYSPVLGEASQRLGEAIRFEGNLPPQLRELAILTMATHWQAQYEWWAHERVALEVGLGSDIIAGIKAGALPDSADSTQHLIYGFAQELLTHHHVSDERYQKAVDKLGESGVVELVILLGYYTLISMTLNVFKVPLPTGEALPFGE